MNSSNLKQRILFAIFKAAIFIATLYYIYYKFHESSDLNKLFQQFNIITKSQVWLIVIVLLLMPINWGIESVKWHLLISKLEPITFLKSFRAVLSGICINNWIPNRMAEFLGRILYIEKKNRIRAIFSTLVGSYSQLIMTVLFGSLGFIIWLKPAGYLLIILIIIAIIINILLVFSYFRISAFSRIIHKIKFLTRIVKYVEILSEYDQTQLFKIFSLSFLRYMVFLLQYFILLNVFNIEIEVIEGLTGVALIFAIQAVIPSITLTEIGIRGAAVIWVFERFSGNLNGMLCAAYSLWIINIIIPTIMGTIFILTLRRSRKSKLE